MPEITVSTGLRLVTNRAALAKPLAAVSRIVEKRNTIPILGNLLLEARDGRLSITGTDLDLIATATVEAEIAAAGAVTIPAQTLSDIVRKLPDAAAITMEMTGDATVMLKAGRSRFTLPALPAADFPDFAAGHLPHRFALPVKELARLIASTQFAISTEETRYYLNGVYLHASGDKLRAVATDGHRLARLELACPAGAEAMPAIIVPRKAIGELAKLAADAEGEVTLEVSPTKIRVMLGDVVLTSKLIDGTFPDYERVIPKTNDKRAVVDRQALAAAVDRVSTVSSERGRGVRFDVTDGQIALSVTNPDAGEAREEIEADYDATAISIGFNAKYLGDTLAVLASDTAHIVMAEPGSPTIFQARQDADLLLILMPMRV